MAIGWDDIAGATNASYAVTNAALGATGSYTVVAVSGGQTISNIRERC